ncbi:prepilin-type N-terminal cleavage/methylation domain-containing protein [Candidatus Berkelbacteria bacterium]|nr:prepilin-type N-terminal cleavage/methylation domain-containing protein [Candidatus Berkelbacteria bacterium]
MTQRGYTLIEVLVASALFVGVLVIVTSSFTSINRINEEIEDIRTTTQTANFVMETLAREIRGATGLRDSDTGTFTGANGQFPYSFELDGRPDTTSGDYVKDRVGLETKKFIPNDNPDEERLVRKSFRFQGDNLIVATENFKFDPVTGKLRSLGIEPLVNLIPPDFAIKAGTGKFSGMSPYAQTVSLNPAHPFVQIEFTLVNSLASAPNSEYSIRTVVASREFLD